MLFWEPCFLCPAEATHMAKDCTGEVFIQCFAHAEEGKEFGPVVALTDCEWDEQAGSYLIPDVLR